jgi:catechol 2,3-dioxygenase-like lactoylglutathione lyase family enzyme
MNRFHVHVRVADLESSVSFYSQLFGAEPAILKADYAKWLLEDPRINFAISANASETGIDHLGFQVESDDELSAIASRLTKAEVSVTRQENASCCYARGNKAWVTDPNRVSWETFYSFGDSVTYGNDLRPQSATTLAESSCCIPIARTNACCASSRAE